MTHPSNYFSVTFHLWHPINHQGLLILPPKCFSNVALLSSQPSSPYCGSSGWLLTGLSGAFVLVRTRLQRTSSSLFHVRGRQCGKVANGLCSCWKGQRSRMSFPKCLLKSHCRTWMPLAAFCTVGRFRPKRGATLQLSAPGSHFPSVLGNEED